MRTTGRAIAGSALLFVSALALQQCRTPEAPPPAEAEAPAAQPELTPVVSIRELMTYIVDPLVDNIFDAVGTDITDKGVVETVPKTDEDWARIRQGAVVLAEASNLLKMPRPVAPAHDYASKNPGELHPEEIQAIIDKNRGAWNAYADALRAEAVKVFDVVDKKDVNGVFQAGSAIDRACENCHLTFYYPNDRDAVIKDRESKIFKEPVKQ
jgi:hypothetical protein